MKKTYCLFIAALALGILPAKAEPKLKVGDPAPDLKVAKWIKDQPIERFETNSIYVVEFWATWCGPCKKSIPHLTELAKKFEGKAKIVGVSIWEAEKTDHANRLAKVGEFVNEMGAKMDYFVAADDNDGYMAKHWMEAAEENGIPTAFIVGKDGKIAWIGYPWAGLDEKLEQAIARTLDMKAIQAEAAKKQQEKNAVAKVNDLFKSANELMAQGKPQEALAALDKLDAGHPELADRSGHFRFKVLLSFDEAAACQQAKKLLEGPLKNNHSALYTMTRDLSEPLKYKNIDWNVTLAIATRMVELAPEDPNSLFALAHVNYRKGDFAKAVETGERAVNKAQAEPDFHKGSLNYMKQMLAKYEAAQQKTATATGGI